MEFTKESIQKGLDLIKEESLRQNKTIRYTCVDFELFSRVTGISKKDFILNFDKIPFSLVRGRVML